MSDASAEIGQYLASLPLEQPSNCWGCDDVHELHSMWSCTDGGVRCYPCYQAFVEDGISDEED